MFIGFYNYTVILTYLSLCISTIGIFMATMGNLKLSVVCLMLSGFCDMFDGKVASTMDRTKDEKRFGIQIDSLCDLICFGVLPIIICYQMNVGQTVYICVATIYLLAALVRLSYFNVVEEERQSKTNETRKYYQGLPVTTIALILPFVFLVLRTNFTYLYTALLLLVAVLFIVPINLKKLSTKGMLAMSMLGFSEFIAIVLRGM